jgi:excisionase family DNA binding protein
MTITFNDLPEAIRQVQQKLDNIERLLSEKSENGADKPEEQFFTIHEAAQFLNLSVPTIYGYVSRSAIPVSKRGKRLYFSKLELIQWVKDGRKKTASEIESEAASYVKSKRGRNG